ncbi:type III secretion system cytoplasmic ring protein SctQ (plasmid) [Ensifer adhaerens]|uniref:type III secretion system cytoplasmic ring protein SctQ n=1 Tax=Ensifer adhaerens TaxID=106592 RepID=UPI00210150A7|nr:type III secretion system cytoplasmic ring protein SctQ [Ensifer adhaerens]UTV41887.1 type III secretion system cytoplasmic ring protein SctQ [Ensifer adhaerens]
MKKSRRLGAGAPNIHSLSEDGLGLSELAAVHVEPTNLLTSVRAAFRLPLPSSDITFEPRNDKQRVTDPIEVAFAIGASPGRWLVPAAALEGLSAALEIQTSLSSFNSLQRDILLEGALAVPLEEVEKRVGEPLSLGTMEEAEDFPIKLLWMIDCGKVPLPAELQLSAEAAMKIGRAFDNEISALNAFTDNLVQPIQIRAGTQQLTVREFESLRPGDIVLCEQYHTDEPLAVLSNHLTAPLRRNESGLVLTSGWQALRTSWEISVMSKQEMSPSEELEPLADLPIELVFEVGRAEFTLKEIARMGEGTVLHANPSLSSPVNIIANRRLVGKGELIRIGEGLGVRVVRLLTDG